MSKAKNTNLNKAGVNKEDEFYTKITDIEKELKHYKHYFKDKIIFCNCDDPEYSNFWKYFQLNFWEFGLKKLVSTHFADKEPSYKMEIVATDIKEQIGIPDFVKTPLEGNGDFRSQECIEILQEADIVITNPPFSLYTEYIKQLMDYKKKFIIIGRETVATNKYIFPLIKEVKIWTGYNNGDMEFVVPSYYEPRETRYREENGIKYRSLGNALWLTNLDIPKRHEDYKAFREYREEDYQKFDYYDAIFVGKLTDIPCDYKGIMGVPITILHHHNPEQYEIVGLLAGNIRGLAGIPSKIDKDGPYVNGKLKFGRILIRNKRLQDEN